MYNSIMSSYLESLEALEKFCKDEGNIKKTVEIAEIIAEVFNKGGKIIIAGNGGSACDATHFAEEFTGRFRKNRKALPVIALTDAAHITCVGNDYGFDEIFSKGVEAFGTKNDVFIGISTSGNSNNIIRAIEKAKENGLKTVCLLGKDGGKLKGIGDFEFIVSGRYADKIQEVHMAILHILIEGTERIMFPENY